MIPNPLTHSEQNHLIHPDTEFPVTLGSDHRSEKNAFSVYDVLRACLKRECFFEGKMIFLLPKGLTTN